MSWKYYLTQGDVTTIIARDASSNLVELSCVAHKHVGLTRVPLRLAMPEMS
jgi:hypothetical protein